MILEISKLLDKSISKVLFSYLFMIAIVYPLFMTSGGYTSLGHDKYLFYRTSTLIMLAVVLVLAVLSRLLAGIKISNSFRLVKTQWFAFIFLFLATLSWFFSSYRMTAWQGNKGWFIGLETYFMVLLAYFFISYFFHYRDLIWLLFLIGSGTSFILGILNRFSFYPFEFPLMAPHFISTLGNVNWIAGYFSVIWPVGAGLYLFAEKKYLRYSAGVYTILAICLGIVLGSDSAFLSFIAVFFILLLISLRDWERYGLRYLELIMVWCLSFQWIRFLRFALPGRFNYGVDGLGGLLTANHFSLYLFLLVLIPYFLMKTKAAFWEKPRELVYRVAGSRLTRKMLIFLPFIMFLLFILAVFMNTALDGFFGLHQSAVFTYNGEWGSFRGATWILAIELFTRMNPLQQLIGLGPDCFAEFLYQFPDLVASSNELFGSQKLMNAHNEILTMLVNVGILGTIAYLGIFITFFIRFMKKGNKDAILYIPAVCVLSYLTHNMVSFGQILNLPFVFIIMGLGESELRRCKSCCY